MKKKTRSNSKKEEVLAAAKEQHKDDELYDTFAKIKLVYEGKCVKEFR